MRIALLQFAPYLGKVSQNIERVDAILRRVAPRDLDLLILPEMALTGYNFPSLPSITPFLEPTTSGPSTRWALSTARRLHCNVTIGYPETTLTPPLKRYNSAVTVSPSGVILAHYRKHFLYYTDESWAEEGKERFFEGTIEGLGKVVMGICMDINPYRFTAPLSAYEFATHALTSTSPLILLPMSWTTYLPPSSLVSSPLQPDLDTLSYWVSRMQPLIDAGGEDEIIVVAANRTGQEGEICYAGSSAVLGIKQGEVRVYGVLGRGEEGVLIANTNEAPRFALKEG
ncbi:MAG: Carbon-nitrogen hydrolase [Candelina mexicana]|nr:MAG: Carbon-nitrogen hydrolase [Candelina mexicana]